MAKGGRMAGRGRPNRVVPSGQHPIQDPGRVNDRLAGEFGVSPRTVRRALDVLEHGTPEQIKAVVPLVPGIPTGPLTFLAFYWVGFAAIQPLPPQKTWVGVKTRKKMSLSAEGGFRTCKMRRITRNFELGFAALSERVGVSTPKKRNAIREWQGQEKNRGRLSADLVAPATR
jgi:hypothetical protein